jgi:hypothetical protein
MPGDAIDGDHLAGKPDDVDELVPIEGIAQVDRPWQGVHELSNPLVFAFPAAREDDGRPSRTRAFGKGAPAIDRQFLGGRAGTRMDDGE